MIPNQLEVISTINFGMYNPDAVVPVARTVTVDDLYKIADDMDADFIVRVKSTPIRNTIMDLLGVEDHHGLATLDFREGDQFVVAYYTGPRMDESVGSVPASRIRFYHVTMVSIDSINMN